MKRLLAVAGAILLAAMLSGCVNFDNPAIPNGKDDQPGVADPAQDFFGKVADFTKADVEQAMRLTGDLDLDGTAEAAPADQVADNCWAFLHGKLNQAAPGVTVAGVVSAFQAARNVKRGVFAGAEDAFYLGCGPLISQVRGDILKLAAKVGIGAALPIAPIGGLLSGGLPLGLPVGGLPAPTAP